jgi:hypothetical protein
MKMRIFAVLALLVLCGAFTVSGDADAACSTACTPTGFPSAPTAANPALTACVFNPSTPQTGTIDAGGCDIGVYYGPGISGSVSGATITGANYFGVLVNGASVDVLNSSISNVGPLTNTFGSVAYRPVGIFYLNGANCPKEGDCEGPGGGYRACEIKGNTITLPLWGKGGIVAKNPNTIVTIVGNTITGNGPNSGIAQNGVEIGDGAAAGIEHNTVSDNQYTGTDTYATGILIYGGPGYSGLGVFEGPNYTGRVTVRENSLSDNDVGVFLSNLNTGNLKPAETDNDVSKNEIYNDGASTNIYAAGIIYESGKGDVISKNVIYGSGY